MPLAVLVVLAQIAIPQPRGFVNDFAGVLDSGSMRHMEAVIQEAREKTRGEIAVVTLPDIGDRNASDVALQIGRQWGVGAQGNAGDPAKNLGVVILLVPTKNHQRGTGQIFIATGRGAEGFLTDARVGRIRDAMLPALSREEYGPGLSLAVDLVAQAFAAEVGATLTNPQYTTAPAPPRAKIPAGWLVIAIILLIVLSRGRLLGLPFWMLASGMGRGRGGWGGGRGGWGGGGGGGGFGGFGGGGGFSGGGAGGRF